MTPFILAKDDVDRAIDELMDKLCASVLQRNPEGRDAGVVRAEAQLLATACDLANKRFQRRIAETNKQCNTLLPIYQLPEEVMAAIFALVLDDLSIIAPAEDYYGRLKSLARVSKDWKRLVFNTPSLWGYLHSDMEPILLEAATQKAKKSLLFITHERHGPPPDSFLKAVKPLASRWRIIRWSLFETDVAFFQQAASGVEEVHLNFCGTNLTMPVNLFDGSAPRLRILKLDSMPIIWTSPVLSGLESLHVENITSLGPSLPAIFKVLSASPRLGKLRLHSVVFRKDTQDSVLSTPLELKHLNDLQLCGITGDVVKHLLASIRVPKCENLVVRCIMGDQTPDTVLGNSLQHLLPTLRRALIATSTVELLVDSRSFEIKGHYSSRTYGPALVSFGMVACPKAIEAFQWFASGVGPELQARPVSIYLEHFPGLDDDAETSKAIDSLFDQLPGTIQLETDVGDSITPIIKSLSFPVTRNGVWHWRLPKLHTLEIGDDEYDPNDIVQMVRHRYDLTTPLMKGKKGKKRPPLVLPVKFQRLYFTGPEAMDNVSYEKLASIVGDDKVGWDYYGEEDGSEDYHSELDTEDLEEFEDYYDTWG